MKLHPSIQLDAIELPRNVSIWEKHIFESFSEIGYLITDYSSVVFEYMLKSNRTFYFVQI